MLDARDAKLVSTADEGTSKSVVLLLALGDAWIDVLSTMDEDDSAAVEDKMSLEEDETVASMLDEGETELDSTTDDETSTTDVLLLALGDALIDVLSTIDEDDSAAVEDKISLEEGGTVASMLDEGETELDSTADDETSTTNVLLLALGDAWIDVLSTMDEDDSAAVEDKMSLEDGETVASMLDERETELDATEDDETSTTNVLLLALGDAWIDVLSTMDEDDSAAVEDKMSLEDDETVASMLDEGETELDTTAGDETSTTDVLLLALGDAWIDVLSTMDEDDSAAVEDIMSLEDGETVASIFDEGEAELDSKADDKTSTTDVLLIALGDAWIDVLSTMDKDDSAAVEDKMSLEEGETVASMLDEGETELDSTADDETSTTDVLLLALGDAWIDVLSTMGEDDSAAVEDKMSLEEGETVASMLDEGETELDSTADDETSTTNVLLLALGDAWIDVFSTMDEDDSAAVEDKMSLEEGETVASMLDEGETELETTADDETSTTEVLLIALGDAWIDVLSTMDKDDSAAVEDKMSLEDDETVASMLDEGETELDSTADDETSTTDVLLLALGDAWIDVLSTMDEDDSAAVEDKMSLEEGETVASMLDEGETELDSTADDETSTTNVLLLALVDAWIDVFSTMDEDDSAAVENKMSLEEGETVASMLDEGETELDSTADDETSTTNVLLLALGDAWIDVLSTMDEDDSAAVEDKMSLEEGETVASMLDEGETELETTADDETSTTDVLLLALGDVWIDVLSTMDEDDSAAVEDKMSLEEGETVASMLDEGETELETTADDETSTTDILLLALGDAWIDVLSTMDEDDSAAVEDKMSLEEGETVASMLDEGETELETTAGDETSTTDVLLIALGDAWIDVLSTMDKDDSAAVEDKMSLEEGETVASMLDEGETELDSTADDETSTTDVLLLALGDAWIDVLSTMDEDDSAAVEDKMSLEEGETVASMLDEGETELDSTADDVTSTTNVLLLALGDAWIDVLSAMDEDDSAAVEDKMSLEEGETVSSMLDEGETELDSTADDETSTTNVLLLALGDAWIDVFSTMDEDDSAAVEDKM